MAVKKDKPEQLLGKLTKSGPLRKGHYGRKASLKQLASSKEKPTGRLALDKQIKAEALFLEANGTRSMEEIAKMVGVGLDTLYRWRNDNLWDQKTRAYQEKFKEELLQKIRNGVPDDQKQLVESETDAKLLEVVKTLVGPSVSAVVSDYLAKLHKEDLKDLSKLNSAIRRKLDRDEQAQFLEDPMMRKAQTLNVKEIGELVTAKINIIKGVRLILGQTTENVGGGSGSGEDVTSVTVVATPEVAESLGLLQKMNVLEAEFSLVAPKGK